MVSRPKAGARRGVAASILVALIAVLVAIALVAPAAADSPINVFLVDSYNKETTAGHSVEFKWVVFNNGTTPYLVKLNRTISSASDVTAEFAENYFTLEPGESHSPVMNVTTDPSMDSRDVTFLVTLTLTRMSDPSQMEEVQETVHLKIKAAIGAGAGQNKTFGIWDNFLPAPFDTNLGAFLFSILGWVLIALFLTFVVDPLVHAITKNTNTTLDDELLRILRGPIFVFVIVFGTITSVEILNLDRDVVANIEFIYHVAVIILLVWVAYRVYDGIVIHYAKEYAKKTDTEMDDVVVPLMEKIGLIIIPLVGIMVILGMLGYDLTALLAGVGFLGIVIGFAAQSTLSNFFAGLQLLTDRPFKVGDTLQLESGEVCEVKKIGMRATELLDGDTEQLVIVPNNEMVNKRIINMVEPDKRLRVLVKINTAYGSDVDKVSTILKQVALEHSNVLKNAEHQPVVRFSDFGDSSLMFKVFIYIDDVANRHKVTSEYRKAVYERFAAEGIEIPFPQRVVHFVDETKKSERN